LVNGIRSSKISITKEFSTKLATRRNKIQGVELPTTPAEAFDDFLDPVVIKTKKSKKPRLGAISNLPDRPDLGVNKAFKVEKFVGESLKHSRRLSRGFSF
jgi:hypothetical protein